MSTPTVHDTMMNMFQLLNEYSYSTAQQANC